MEQINRIEAIRADIKKDFDENGLIPDSEEMYYSPDNHYSFIATSYKMTDPTRNRTCLKVKIFDNIIHDQIFEFIRNDDFCFHTSLTINGKYYLILSEDLEGKSIYNLAVRIFHSYSY